MVRWWAWRTATERLARVTPTAAALMQSLPVVTRAIDRRNRFLRLPRALVNPSEARRPCAPSRSAVLGSRTWLKEVRQ